ncbi:MAG: hypothetical protein ACTSRI_21120 [Promethearchaeota archaeon]
MINEIFNEVLNDIVPTSRELNLIFKIVEKLKNLLEKRAKELNIIHGKIEPQGSTGIKQTQLRNDFDIDLFIGLDYEMYKPKYIGLNKNKLKKASKKDFLELCNNWIIKSLTLKEFKNPRLLYAEHPYVTVDYLTPDVNIKIDIVLYFDLDVNYIKKYGPITSVDRSPWHGRFIKEQLSPEQKNDVRLLKQFFKCCYSYGDKSAVGKVGFIGYSSELLIYYFGTIQNLFKNFNKLDKQPLDYYKRSTQDLNKITHFQNDYLIVVDPIDKNRNVASAISKKAYKYCNQKITEFLKRPSKDFFELKPIPEINLADFSDPILLKIYIVELKNSNNNIHYTINRDKLYSLGEYIKVNGEKEACGVERFGKIFFEVYFEEKNNEYNLSIYCEKPKISKTYVRRGPPLNERGHANKFMKKNPEYFTKDGYLWIESKRKYTDFIIFLKNYVKNKIPENLEVVSISQSLNTKTSSGKKTIYVLKNMILPHS